MKTIINSAKRTVKFTGGKGRGFTLSLDYHGVCVRNQIDLSFFADVCFLREYVNRHGTQNNVNYLLENAIETIDFV